MYNLTWMDESNNLADLFAGLSTTLGGNILGMVILLVVWVVTMVLTRQRDFNDSFLTSNFITLLLGVLLWFASMVEFWVLMIVLVLFLLSVFMRYVS